MFTVKKKKIGNFIKYCFANKENSTGFTVVPERGAVLTELFFDNHSVLDGFTKSKELETLDWAKSALLVPFPNRLADGQYEFEGKQFQFPVNEKNTNSAIHGFGMFKKMKAVSVQCYPQGATIRCTYKDNGRRKAYPFPHHFFVEYGICKQSFAVRMVLKNSGKTNFPAGLGWHPYFSLGESIDLHKMKLPKGFSLKKVDIDDRMIPTGKLTAFDDFKRMKKIGNTVLDNCFVIENEKAKSRFEIILQHENKQLTYWQDINSGKLNYVQLFTPPNRNTIAIEPMTCNINAFKNKDGLSILAPGESLELSCGIDFNIK